MEGEILLKGGLGLHELLATEISVHDPKNVDEKVKYAVQKFRRHRASVEDKKEAARILADVLEFLRPQIKQLPLTKDEGDLFNIANNFVSVAIGQVVNAFVYGLCCGSSLRCSAAHTLPRN